MTNDSLNLITPEELDEYERVARTDQWWQDLSGSDVRRMVGEIRRSRSAALPSEISDTKYSVAFDLAGRGDHSALVIRNGDKVACELYGYQAEAVQEVIKQKEASYLELLRQYRDLCFKVGNSTEDKEKAFANIMGAIDMPPDGSPEYDEWLFNKTWDSKFSTREPVLSVDSIIGGLKLLHLAIYHKDPHSELLIRSKEILQEIKGAVVAYVG